MAKSKGARRPRPKRVKPKTAEEIIAEFGVSAELPPPSPTKTRRGRLKPPSRRNRRLEAYRKRVAERRKPKTRTIIVDIDPQTRVPQSQRGTHALGTERKQASEIIHFYEYDAPSKQLAIQLTAAGKWQWYTYQGVSISEFDAFENTSSFGRHYNEFIKKHPFLRGNTLRGFKQNQPSF